MKNTHTTYCIETPTNQLFNELNDLCNKVDAFSFKDYISIGGGFYRIFSYRLASYSDFLHPSALECRGTMFEIDADCNFIRIASRTPQKFFNAYENPMTMFDKTVLTSEIDIAMDKLDGSIISTFIDNDNIIRTKSHGSLHSEHAYNSNALLSADSDLESACYNAEQHNFTVNLEYTSPEYRIVLPYQEEKLTVLNIRHRETGEIIVGDKLKTLFPELYKKSVFVNQGNINKNYPIQEKFLKDSIDKVKEMKDIEGFVVKLKTGEMFKVKTNWYSSLHFTRDSIMVDSRLYEVVLTGGSDDLKQIFSTDKFSLEKIEKMERLVFMCYNKLQKDVETFVENHRQLQRKEFAAAVLKNLSTDMGQQGIAFNLYAGKEVNYKEIMMKYMREVLKNF